MVGLNWYMCMRPGGIMMVIVLHWDVNMVGTDGVFGLYDD